MLLCNCDPNMDQYKHDYNLVLTCFPLKNVILTSDAQMIRELFYFIYFLVCYNLLDSVATPPDRMSDVTFIP